MKSLRTIYFNKFVVINSILPLTFGILVYILFRSKWLMFIELFTERNEVFNSIQSRMIGIKSELPTSFIYSFPGAAWAYSVNCLLCYTARNASAIKKYSWYAIGGSIPITFEILQLFGFFPGTFDINDIIWTIIAIFISFMVIAYMNKGRIC